MFSAIHGITVVGENPVSSMSKHDSCKSSKRTKETGVDDHIHWDPGGVRVFPGSSPPGEHSPPTYRKLNDAYMIDEGQLNESEGAVGPKNKPKESCCGLGDTKTAQSQPNKGRASASENEEVFINEIQESDGAHGMDTMKHTSKEVMPSMGESVMVPCMSLPVKDDSYVLGLRPIACSETYQQLEKTSYVPGLLPFKKLPFAHSLLKED
jgi:hypothetical protein